MNDEIKNNIEKAKKEKLMANNLLKKMKKEVLTKEEYKNLQYFLLKYEYNYRYNYPICKTQITDDKIMFISDTHYGNKLFEDNNLVVSAYNTALQQNIKTVVHVGDIIEACSYEHNKKYETVLKELEMALNYMPDELTTKLLLGNHDYYATVNFPELIPHFFNNPKLDILGINKVILNWNGQADICVSHPINRLNSKDDKEENCIVTLEGHHHFYKFNEKEAIINLPTLSNEAIKILSSNLPNFCPLFIIASKQAENTMLFKVYCIDRDMKNVLKPSETIEINTETKQLILHK